MSKILVVDDSVENLELLSSELEAWGHDVTRATSGADALELAETLRPDLILLDVTMPEMDGIEVCRRLKSSQELKGIPVILSVTPGADEQVVVGLDAGAQDYIPKPCDERILALGGQIVATVPILITSIIELATLSLNLFFFVILIKIILSWVAPHTNNPAAALLGTMAEPILRPFRRFIPPMGALDVSPIFAIILLQAAVIFLQTLKPFHI